MLSTELQSFLWGNRDEPYYAAHPRLGRETPVSKDDALRRLSSEATCYFAPVPRVALGNRKEHCAERFDALWCDIDRGPGVDQHALLTEAKGRLAGYDLVPSVAVYSGNRGLHLYWKLSGDIPIAEVEQRGRRLSSLLGGDSCWDRTHLLRHPGTVNPKSGRRAEIIEFSAEIHDVEVLQGLGPLVPAVARVHRPSSATTTAGDSAWLAAAEELDGWLERDELDHQVLSPWQRRYLITRPTKRWRTRHGQTRNEVEQGIVYRLTGKGAGASDVQVKEFADEYLPRHIEEWGRRGDYYIDRTILAARRLHYNNGWITSPLGGFPRKRDVAYRHASVDDLVAVLALVDGQPVSRFIGQVQARGWSRSTAYRYKDGLVQEGLAIVKDGMIRRR
jgi:hypothetical protein